MLVKCKEKEDVINRIMGRITGGPHTTGVLLNLRDELTYAVYAPDVKLSHLHGKMASDSYYYTLVWAFDWRTSPQGLEYWETMNEIYFS